MQYDILNTEVTTIDGEKTTLEGYKGNVLLLVNVASKCGLTPQYEQLEALQKLGERRLYRAWVPLQSVFGPGAGQRRRDQNILQYHLWCDFPAVQQD
jgi:glutathione peroxidase-family protein